MEVTAVLSLPKYIVSDHAAERWTERFPASPYALSERLERGGPAVIDPNDRRLMIPVVAPENLRDALGCKWWARLQFSATPSGLVLTTAIPIDDGKTVRFCRRTLALTILAQRCR